MIDNKTPSITPEYTIEKFDDEVLLYTESGNSAIYLNEAAHAVWALCKESLTVGEIIEYLEGLYPEEKAQIRNDVLAAIDILESNNVIELSDDQP